MIVAHRPEELPPARRVVAIGTFSLIAQPSAAPVLEPLLTLSRGMKSVSKKPASFESRVPYT